MDSLLIAECVPLYLSNSLQLVETRLLREKGGGSREREKRCRERKLRVAHRVLDEVIQSVENVRDRGGEEDKTQMKPSTRPVFFHPTK